MAKPTVESAATRYRAAKKALTRHEGKLSVAKLAPLESRLAKAEGDLLEQVAVLIGKTVMKK
ncbi:MAG TPA: hypothetical protein VK696_02165 [Steroidobacteraceae bacterium]|jgi:hypothetical protein|nr:hypothetical protein [Steroidobacteraceae bacterium]